MKICDVKNMERINHLKDRKLDAESAETFLTSALGEVVKRVGDCNAKRVLAEFLAFKFWHENLSCNVNDSILEVDVDYIRLNWEHFRKQVNECCKCSGGDLTEEIDYKFCAEVLHSLSDCISYEHPVEVCAALQKVFKGEDEIYIEGLRRLIHRMKTAVVTNKVAAV